MKYYSITTLSIMKTIFTYAFAPNFTITQTNIECPFSQAHSQKFDRFNGNLAAIKQSELEHLHTPKENVQYSKRKFDYRSTLHM